MSGPPALLVALDLAGVFVFALSGAVLGVQKRFDVFGVLVLAAAAALGGGVARDLLLDVRVPAVLADPRYLLVALLAGALVCVGGARRVERSGRTVLVLDAGGLGLFVVTGTRAALDAGLGAVAALTVGCITGIGGGVARDVLAREVPAVLQRELYAVPALVGAAVVVAGDGLGLAGTPVTAAAVVLVVVLRIVSLARGWHAPVPPLHGAVRQEPGGEGSKEPR